MLIRVALGLALFETLVLAGVLLAWADRVAGGRVLAAFLLGIAVWITGNELPNWFGPEVWPTAIHFLAMAPLVSVFFFHFAVSFCGVSTTDFWGRNRVRLAYLLGASATMLAQFSNPAHLEARPYLGWIAVANLTGWVASMGWVVLAAGGISVLLRGYARSSPPVRQQIAAVTASCLWGLLCLTGYGISLLHWPVYPFPLLLLPLYPVILVYGVLRYGVFVANAWARRALVWTLLLAVGIGVVAVMPLLLPFESRWVNGLAVAASCLALTGPVRRFAQQLIYPGGKVLAADLASWRRALLASASLPALGEQASALLSERLGMAVDVTFEPTQQAQRPQLACLRNGGEWALALRGWEAAPPGLRHVAELFGSTVLDAASAVEQAQQRANEERQRLLQERLAELGALAATVAHDIRNPLNIISMAVATAPTDTRREVATQITRIAHLSSDLLDYAKPWTLAPARVNLSALVRQCAAQPSEALDVQFGPGLAAPLWLNADPQRLQQALTNLLANARNAGQEQADNGSTHVIHLDAEQQGQRLLLHVCDNGPGVPESMRERLFEPFASRSQGGTGLGLAIVARIMAAHGGTASLAERAGWRTCFTLSFPL
jgi:signal transduction histidine kinase